MNAIEKIKSEIDLKKYLEVHEGHTFNGSKTLCPFHNDRVPSMDVEFKNNCWVYFCHACGAGGDIISYKEKKYRKSLGAIIGELKEQFNIKDSSGKKTEYIYRDIKGNEIFKKVKMKPLPGLKPGVSALWHNLAMEP